MLLLLGTICYFSVALVALLSYKKRHHQKRVDGSRPKHGASTFEPGSACGRPFSGAKTPFPSARACVVTQENDVWWKETVARIHDGDFSPDAPSSVPVRPLEDLMAHLRVVTASVVARGDPELHEPVDDIWAARALIATDFDVARAADAASSYVDRRKTSSGIALPIRSVVDRAITLVPFEDRFGRPVAITRVRYVSSGHMETMTNHFLSTCDGMISHMLLAREERGGQVSKTNPLEQFILCVDCEGMSWKNACMEYCHMMKRECAERYLERLAAMYVLNPPASLGLFSAMLDPILHARTKRKIQLVKSRDVPRVMRRLVGEDRADDLLPPNLGGSAKPFPALGHGRTLEDKVGALLAKTWRRLGVAKGGIAWEIAEPANQFGFKSLSTEIGCMSCLPSSLTRHRSKFISP